MKKFLRKKVRKIIRYDRIAGIAQIARRYFATNSFDGVLTVLGIIIGNYLGGVRQANIVISTGLGAAIALLVSGLWGTYVTENAERIKSMKELESSVLIKLGETDIGKASRFATTIVAFINGFSPFIVILTVMLPFFFSSFFGVMRAYLISVILAFAVLFFLGVFLGKISKESLIKNGLKMLFAGFACALLAWLLIR